MRPTPTHHIFLASPLFLFTPSLRPSHPCNNRGEALRRVSRMSNAKREKQTSRRERHKSIFQDTGAKWIQCNGSVCGCISIRAWVETRCSYSETILLLRYISGVHATHSLRLIKHWDELEQKHFHLTEWSIKNLWLCLPALRDSIWTYWYTLKLGSKK